MSDEIIREMWQVKDDMSKEHGYDVRALAAYLQNKERTESRQVVNLGDMNKHPVRGAAAETSREI